MDKKIPSHSFGLHYHITLVSIEIYVVLFNLLSDAAVHEHISELV